MTIPTPPPTGGEAHVEAFRCTGTSPGRTTILDRALDRSSPRYEVHGPRDASAVVVLGGISATRHLAPTPADPGPGWWPGVVGAGLGLDPTRRRLVGVDWRVSAPPVPSTHDQARLVAAALDAEGVRRVDLVGASYGGMVALAFAALFPERVDRLVVLCAAHRTHPMATAWRSIQRAIVRRGSEDADPRSALALARALAMTTYRSAEEFEARFASAPESSEGGTPRFPVEAYLESRGRAFAREVSPADFLALSASIDGHRVDPGSIRAPITLLSVDTDTLVPPWLVEELAAGCRGAVVHRCIRSPYGHDAFLKERDVVTDLLRSVLERGEVAR